jgi:hypothetical protein
MKEISKEIYPTIDSLSNLFFVESIGFRERIRWNGGEYLVFVRGDKFGDYGKEFVIRKLIV